MRWSSITQSIGVTAFRTCHVAVGTPGRILSLLQSGALPTSALRLLVLDEADKLLSDAFHDAVMAITAFMPKRKQVSRGCGQGLCALNVMRAGRLWKIDGRISSRSHAQ